MVALFIRFFLFLTVFSLCSSATEIVGRLLLPLNIPLPNTPLSLLSSSSSSSNTTTSSSSISVTAVSREDGHFTFHNISPGAYSK